MDRIFNPRTLAVIGVSSRKGNMAANIITNLLNYGYRGEIYPVGRRGGVIKGMRIHRTVADVPAKIDAAAILTPANTVPDYMIQCGEKGIKRLYIESGGFDEYGAEGVRVSRRIQAIADRYGMRFVGPNCIGVINNENGLCVPFPLLEHVPPGPVSILSQSGGVGISYLKDFHSENLGINKFVSMGNKLNIDEVDILPYLAQDRTTKIICMYLEGIDRGRELLNAAMRIEKPIIVHKSNIGKASQKIAASHTSALLSDDRIVDAALKQAGIIRADEVRKMLNDAKIFTLPPMKGPRLALISRSGGHAVIGADNCERYGFQLPRFPRSLLEQVEKKLRASVIKLDNPMDLGDLFDPDVYRYILSKVAAMPQFDGILFLFAYFSVRDPKIPEDMIRFLMEATKKHKKPIALCLISWENEAQRLKKQYRFPIYTTTEEAIAALATSRDYFQRGPARKRKVRRFRVDRSRVNAVLERAREQGRTLLGAEAFEILEAYGIPAVPTRIARTPAEAASAAREIGFPVVVKVHSQQISHKSDVAGVRLGLASAREVQTACREIRAAVSKKFSAAALEGFAVQPMIPGGHELILGTKHDRDFGPVLLLGWGGKYVEALSGSAIRIAPITPNDAREMIAELQGSKILRGMRGEPPADLRMLEQCLQRLAQLAFDFPQIAEIDVNPLKLLETDRGAFAVDVRMILEYRS